MNCSVTHWERCVNYVPPPECFNLTQSQLYRAFSQQLLIALHVWSTLEQFEVLGMFGKRHVCFMREMLTPYSQAGSLATSSSMNSPQT